MISSFRYINVPMGVQNSKPITAEQGRALQNEKRRNEENASRAFAENH